jgi:hypothetical protein
MSGYLERLTRAALRPTETLRPLAGSVFSPPRRRDGGDGLPRESVSRNEASSPSAFESVSTGESRPTLDPAPRPAIAPDRPVQPARSGPLAGVPRASALPTRPDASRRETPADSNAIFTPTPLLSLPDSPRNPPRPTRTVPQPPADQPLAAPGAPLQGARFSQEPHRPSPSPIRNDQPPGQPLPSPLLPLQPSATHQSALPPGRGPAHIRPQSNPIAASLAEVTRISPSTRRREPSPPPGTRSQPAREPDEIHIHIGRIEVTAPAAAPPVRQAPARKGPSLDEYLKRPGRPQ